ncbi:MAG: VanZ family protein, partial [Limisphaerales bacterium]
FYAVTDELHQAFEPTRQGSVIDVLIDTVGAALGILVIWAIGRWRKRW